MAMDIWKFYAVTHRDHLVCNPTSEAKINELVELLPLKPGARILDIACGKAEQLIRIVKHHDATGVGIDISPYEIEEAKRRATERGAEDRVELIVGDGAEYPAEPNSFDLAMCLGASWIWNGHRGTIESLKTIVKPGGLIAVGEPYRLKEPDPEYVKIEPDFANGMLTHAENVEIAVELGLTPLYVIVSDQNDWDRYEGLRMRAAELYAEENPDDPDVPEILSRQRAGRDTYLKHGRETVNWAIYLFRAP